MGLFKNAAAAAKGGVIIILMIRLLVLTSFILGRSFKMTKISDKMLEIAMKKAVSVGLVPKATNMGSYLKYWDGMKKVLEAVIETKSCPLYVDYKKSCQALKKHEAEMKH